MSKISDLIVQNYESQLNCSLVYVFRVIEIYLMCKQCVYIEIYTIECIKYRRC